MWPHPSSPSRTNDLNPPPPARIPGERPHPRPAMKTIHRSLLATLLATWCLPAQEPDLPYVSGSTGADGDLIIPASLPNRYGFATAYDPEREEVVVFGGYDGGESGVRSAGYKPETWIFDGTAWALRPTATFVSARHSSQMVYDPVRQHIVMFGGRRADNAVLNDTWIWDGNDWSQLTPATAPPVRYDHQMVWDSTNNRVLLFGGHSGSAWLEDLWAWNGTTWTEITTTNTPESDFANQNYGQMVWDSANDRAIYYSEYYRKTYALVGDTWNVLSPADSPDVGYEMRMIYDPSTDTILAGPAISAAQTWRFQAGEWVIQPNSNTGEARREYGMVWDSTNNRALMFGGIPPNGNSLFQDTRAWDGSSWTMIAGRTHYIDMNEKADGVWNYQSIVVPSYVDVYFIKNPANSPVTWLATENVEIEGRVIVNGENAPPTDYSGEVAEGGPGGFAGGAGGIRFDVSGRYAGTPGQGPGGGIAPAAASQAGGDAQFTGTYGNSLLQPMIGGSGGGGGSSSDNNNGGNGGGGGGAILIATSKDMVINGAVLANGGNRNHGGATWGGFGSGGAIRLIADRISGSGQARALAGNNAQTGRIRIEAYYRPFAPNSSPAPSATAPVEEVFTGDVPMLSITQVAGENVAQPPTGSTSSPDVVFTEAGEVSITVQGSNVPVGTPVSLRITSSQGVLELPGEGEIVTIGAGGTATFTTVVPQGQGTIQAFAEFTLDN